MTDYLLVILIIIVFIDWYEHSHTIASMRQRFARWKAKPKASIEWARWSIHCVKKRTYVILNKARRKDHDFRK